MRHPAKAPVPSRADSAINEILQYAGARPTFEKLCGKGMDRDLLKMRLLALHGPRAKKRTLSVNPKDCRKLAKKLAALLREIDNLNVIAWRRRRELAKECPPLRFVNTPEEASSLVSRYRYRRSPVPFDVNLLRQQLHAGARYFARVGKAKKPIPYGFAIDDMDMALTMLLEEVKKCTGREHYKEIALLYTAATGGRHQVTEGALKMRVSRYTKN